MFRGRVLVWKICHFRWSTVPMILKFTQNYTQSIWNSFWKVEIVWTTFVIPKIPCFPDFVISAEIHFLRASNSYWGQFGLLGVVLRCPVVVPTAFIWRTQDYCECVFQNWVNFVMKILEVSCGSGPFGWSPRCNLWYNMYAMYYVTNSVQIDIHSGGSRGCNSANAPPPSKNPKKIHF